MKLNEKYIDDFSLLMGSTSDGLWVWDFANSQLLVSDQLLQILGYEREDFIQNLDWVISLLHPDDVDLINYKLSEHLTKNTTHYEAQQRFRRKEGSYVWVRLRGKLIEKNPDGTPKKAVGTMTDIHREKVLELKLRASERMLKDAQKLANVGSWEFSFGDQKISWSEQMFSIFSEDIRAGEPTFENHRNSIHPEDREMWENTVSKAMKDGLKYNMEFRILLDDHSIKWILAQGEGVFDSSKLVAIRGTCQDITKKKSLEIELDAQKLRSIENQKEITLGKLSANLSHEINNPLTIIGGNVQLLKHQLGKDHPLITSIDNAVNRIVEINKTLSFFSGTKKNDEVTRIFLHDAFKTVLNLFKVKFEMYNINFEMDIDSELTVNARMSEVLSVILSLVRNSFDAIKNNQGSWIRIHAYTEKSNVFIRITDSGFGIKDSSKEIFGIFYTTKDEGLGLGLSISKSILESYNGSLIYDPFQNNTSFLITIPA